MSGGVAARPPGKDVRIFVTLVRMSSHRVFPGKISQQQGRPVSGLGRLPLSRLPFLVTLALLCSATHPLLADTGRCRIPLRDDASDAVRRGLQKAFEAQDWAAGFRILQAHQESIWGRHLLVVTQERSHPCTHRVSRSATLVFGEALRALPAEAWIVYQERYGETARSLYQRALERQDPEELLRVAELYPLATFGLAAALAAGDLFLERGELDRARNAWSRISFGPGEVPLATTGPVEGDVALRLELLPALSEPRDLSSPDVTGMFEPSDALRPTPAPPETAPHEPEAPDAPGRAATIPPPDGLPFRSARIAWTRTHRTTRGGVGPVPRPALGDGWIAIDTGREVIQYSTDDGSVLCTSILPRARGFVSFIDAEARFVRAPATDGRRILTSFIHSVNQPERFAGYSIRMAIPRRALKAIPLDGRVVEWDSSEESVSDPELAQLSFNSPPLIIGNRAYALGWREAGYIDGYLVCIDLDQGRPVWKTILASNQFELTVFGEMAQEPLLGDLHLEDGILYVSTQLGAMAALRPQDGRVLWITEYPQRRVQGSRQYYRRRTPEPDWDRNPWVSIRRRLVVTPLDSRHAYIVNRDTGTILALESRRLLGSAVLGSRGDQLVSANGATLRLTKITDDFSDQTVVPLAYAPAGRPKVAGDGVVYTSRRGLHYRPFAGSGDDEIVLYWDPDPKPPGASGRRAEIMVLSDRIIVATGDSVRCFTAAPASGERRF